MRRIAACVLLLILAVAGAVPANAQRITPEENARRSSKAAKKQEKMLKKANKRQRKMAKKADKAGRKAAKKNSRAYRK